MVKAIYKRKDGKPVLLMGLSDVNIEKLREGKPIVFDLEPLGLEGSVAIMHGKTEEDIAEELSKHFKLPS